MRYLLFICFLCCSLVALAQSRPYKVSQISLAEGLSQSIVYSIVQDDAGYLWFATQDGLNRFDGIRFDVFRNEPFDTTSISSNQISAMLYDRDNRLWIGTHNHGLNLYNKSKRNFSVVYGLDEEKNIITNQNSIRCLFEDKEGNIWVGTPGGIAVINNNREIDEYPIRLKDNDTLPVFVNSIIEYQNKLLIATGRGLFLFNNSTKKADFISSLPTEKTEKQWIFTLLHDERSNEIIAGTHTGLYSFIIADNRITEITTLLYGNAVPVIAGNNEEIYVSVEGKGLYNLSKEKNTAPLKYVLSSPALQLGDMSEIISLHFDKINEGLLWAGTSTRGILKFTPVLKNFHTDKLHNSGLKNSFVTAVMKDRDDNKWIGTPEGLLRVDQNGNYRIFNDELQINKLAKNYIGAITQDKNGRLWVGKLNGILYSGNPDSGNPEFKNALTTVDKPTEAVRAFYQTHRNELYAVTKLSILKLNNEKNTFDIVVSNPDTNASRQPGYSLNSMVIDKKDNLWIASTTGLILIRKNQLQPEIFYYNKDNTSGLRNHTIQHVVEDHNGNIWIATTNGISRITDANGIINIKNYSSQDGLGNNFTYAILENEKDGKLWISTNGGLSSFDPVEEKFSTFSIHDGLQSNEFNSGAFSIAYDGEMYFGGIDGYTHFYPEEINLDLTPPRVFISAFNIPGNENKTVYFDDASIDKKIKLKYFENSFTINFSGLHYINPLKNTYSYKLEGYQENWISSGSNNSINFSQLPPGDYNLHVRAANSDGIMNEEGDILTISIRPPFWHTPWFYTAIFITVGLILYGLHRYRLSLKMQQVMAVDKIRKETAQDFHDELGHKLTTIAWFGEIVRSKLKSENKDVKEYLDKIVETSQQMYHTMKDLLWAMDPEKDTVNDLYAQIKEFGEDLFDKTGIEFNSTNEVELKENKNLPLHHKRQVILIFKEVMHNALKHSGADKTEFKLERNNGHIQFHFSDNGKGYTLNGKPTGFGLKNVKRRSELIQADLKINSTGTGTTVDLSFSSN